MLPAQDVILSGDRIEEVRPHGSQMPASGLRRYDGSGGFLIPGLWDSTCI